MAVIGVQRKSEISIESDPNGSVKLFEKQKQIMAKRADSLAPKALALSIDLTLMLVTLMLDPNALTLMLRPDPNAFDPNAFDPNAFATNETPWKWVGWMQFVRHFISPEA